MELSSSNIKKFLKFSYISGSNFSSLEKKKKKNLLQENFLYFRKWKLQKNFLYFLHKTFFLYFQKRKPREKKIIFQETENLKTFYISGNGTFFYFWKRVFRTLAYLELEAYSKPWYI